MILLTVTDKAYEGGRAIGRFQALLADLPGKPLHETIPSFHDVEKRIDSFMNTLKNDPVGRVKETDRETDFILKRADEMRIIQRLGREGKIPVRITHNDTKFNNILFDVERQIALSYRPRHCDAGIFSFRLWRCNKNRGK